MVSEVNLFYGYMFLNIVGFFWTIYLMLVSLNFNNLKFWYGIKSKMEGESVEGPHC